MTDTRSPHRRDDDVNREPDLFDDLDRQRHPDGYPVGQGVGATGTDLAKVAGGSVLVLLGLALRGRAGLLLAAGGGALAYSGRRRRKVPQRTSVMPVEAFATMTIDASPRELYDHWRHMDRLPQVFDHVLFVEDIGNGRSTWQVRGPLKRLQWDAEITHEEPGRRLAWRSLPGGDVDHEGEVSFRRAPGDRGTIVTVHMKYAPPGGKIGAAVAGLMGQAPSQTLREDLRRLKQLVETGEIATTAGQPAARTDRVGTAGRFAERAADAAAILNRPLDTQEIP